MRIPHKKLLTKAFEKSSKRLRTCPYSNTIFYAINDKGQEVAQVEILPATSSCIRWLYYTELNTSLIMFKKEFCQSIVNEYRDFIADKKEEWFNFFFDTPYFYTVN